MGRISLLILYFVFSALYLSAQSGGYSNLEFIENKGQWDQQVKFRADMSAGSFFLHNNGYTVLLHDTTDLRNFAGATHGNSRFNHFTGKNNDGTVRTPGVIHSHAYRVSFVGANPSSVIQPEKVLDNYNNYIKGSDSSKWASNCRIYLGITYKDIYPGIDLRYYTDGGSLKYDLIVHPGADPSRIALKYEGQNKLSLKKGRLLVTTSVSEVKELAPLSYQAEEAGRKNVDCKYVLTDNNTVRFKVGEYSAGETLVIDPTMVFCSFTGSTADNWGFTATYGPDGSMFLGGIVFGTGFPVSTGAFQTGTTSGRTSADYWDIGIIKLNTNGRSRVYATYLGGSGNEYPHSLVVDNSGQLVILGRTYSTNFPLYPSGNQVGPGGGSDIFITRLNAAGSAPVGSMKIGGKGLDGANVEDQGELELHNQAPKLNGMIRNYGDWSRSEVILDGAGNIYVATCTQSTDILPVGASFQSTPVGGQDGLILKINPTVTNVIFGAYLGGTGDDAALALDINPVTNDIYVAGSTTSGVNSTTNFPGMSAASYQGGFYGQIDGFVSVISNDGSTLKSSTYLSYSKTDGNSVDMVYGVKFDNLGFPYVMGTSTGSWPVVNAKYFNTGAKQFVIKLKQDLSSVVYSTIFGSKNATKPNISPVAFLVDRCQNVYISGWGGWYSESEPDPYFLQGTLGMPTTNDAIQSTTDNHDFYFIVLKRNADTILYGSFFGQTDDANSIGEHVDGGTSRYDKNGIIYEGICANCSRGDPNVTSGPSAYIKFPTTTGVYSFYNKAGTHGCNMAGVKIAFNYAGVSAGLKLSLDGRGDSLGCAPLDVTLQDTIRNAKLYIWRYGDGVSDTTTSYIVNHTFTAVGVYRVMLIAIDSSSCNVSDTVYRNITVKDNRADLSMTIVKNAPCTALSFKFTNTSTHSATAPSFTSTSFLWDFGDGSAQAAAPVGAPGVDHPYAASGTYTVKLILTDTNYCNYPDTLTQRLGVAENVKAGFETPQTGCAPYYAVFTNTTIAGSSFLWDFGDGTTSTDFTPPPHLYTVPNVYTVTLTATDPNTCNQVDTYSTQITIQTKPTAGFSFSPNPPAANTPTVFAPAASADVTKFVWNFGDGSSTTKTTADTVIHQYNATDTFQACLIVFNASGCSDTICQAVPALVNPLLDVPNAFTPGRFGQNGIVKVMGFGITRMTFRIYNRWGQLVFQSNDRNIGWDGTYKGNLQPMDVYAYTLEATFYDGTHVSKKGDITLVR